MRFFVTEGGKSRLEDEIRDVLAKMLTGESASILSVKNAVPEGARLLDIGNGMAIVDRRAN